jgi:hypothetical protein
VSPTGDSATILPWQGESGRLNALDQYNSKGKLTSAVFTSIDGEMSFDLSAARRGLRVPADEYELTSGTAEKGAEHVRIRRGSMRAITVKRGSEQVVSWGGPLRIEFDFFRTDAEKVTVNLPKFFGSAEEEYFDFYPGGKSPEILVRDKKSGKELWSGKFCES